MAETGGGGEQTDEHEPMHAEHFEWQKELLPFNSRPFSKVISIKNQWKYINDCATEWITVMVDFFISVFSSDYLFVLSCVCVQMFKCWWHKL